MASRVSIQGRVDGLEEARRALEAVLQAARAALPEVLDVVGQQVVTEVRRRAPLLTGRLRRSYTHEVDPQGRWLDVGTNVEYAPYQEFGTRFQDGTPHFRPGIEATMPKIPKLIAEGVARAERAAASGARSGGGLGSVVSRIGGIVGRLGG